MPITEQAKEALRASMKAQPTIVHPQNDLGYYDALLARNDLPATVSASEEIQWIAFNLGTSTEDKVLLRSRWESAPSKVAATWLRRLRMKGEWQEKFWTDTWPFYIESRLSLELKAGSPPAAKKRGRAEVGDGGLALQASIDQFKRKGVVDGNGGAS